MRPSPSRRLSRVLGGGAFLATAIVAGAAAATPAAKLTYVRDAAAARCPDEGELRRAVAARLGYDPFFPWARSTVVAEISRGRTGFRGRVIILDERGLSRGERAIDATSDDCGEVMRALALAISIAVDDLDLDPVPPAPNPATPPATASPPAPEPAPAPEPSRPSPSEADRALPPPPPRPTRAPFGFAASFSSSLSAGLAPSAAVGATIAVERRLGVLSIGLEARADLPASAAASTGGRVRSEVFLGSVVPCLHVLRPFFGCAFFSAGAFDAAGVGIAVSRNPVAPFAAAGLRLGVEVPLGRRVFLLGRADGLVPLTRPTVQIDRRAVFTPAPVTPSVGFGAGVYF
jgi:hypothetical protein